MGFLEGNHPLNTRALWEILKLSPPLFLPPSVAGFPFGQTGGGSRHLSLLESTRMQLIHLSISCYYFAIHILCIRKDMNATEGFTAAIPNRSGVFFIMVFLFRFTLTIRRLVSFREKSVCGTVGFWLRWLNCASRLTSSQPSGILAVELCTPHHPISPTL
jgi:hypothetical protein